MREEIFYGKINLISEAQFQERNFRCAERENTMIDRLIEKIKATNAPIVVGLDPMMKFVPEHIRKKAFAEYGETLEGAAEAVWQYNKGIVDAIYDLIPAVKPQIAMYEQFGIPGMIAFKRTVDYCKEKGLIVIGDVKRGETSAPPPKRMRRPIWERCRWEAGRTADLTRTSQR